VDQMGDPPGLIFIGPAPAFRDAAAGHQAVALEGIHQGLGISLRKQIQTELWQGIIAQTFRTGKGRLPVGVGQRHEMKGERVQARSPGGLILTCRAGLSGDESR